MVTTLLGIIIFVNESQYVNALSSILIISWGITMFVNIEQLPNS